MSDYGKQRKQVLMHDATYLLTHEPISELYLNWTNPTHYSSSLSTEDTLKKTFLYIQILGENEKVHLGTAHTLGKTTPSRAPEYLLVLLWLLRYGIYDKATKKNLIRFFAPNAFISTDRKKVEYFFHAPRWIRNNIIYPITNFIYYIVENESNTRKILFDHYIYSEEHHWKKIKEFMMYTLTVSYINLIVNKGPSPMFVITNDNTTEISTFLQDNTKRISAQKQTKIDVHAATNLYELFFAAIPNFIEYNVVRHHELIFRNFLTKSEIQKTTFHPNETTMHHFVLCLPLQKNSSYEAVSLVSYFEAILKGEVSLDDLITKIDYVTEYEKNPPKKKQVSPTKTATKRKKTSEDGDTSNKKSRTRKTMTLKTDPTSFLKSLQNMKRAKKDIDKALRAKTPSLNIFTQIATYSERLQQEIKKIDKLFTDQYEVEDTNEEYEEEALDDENADEDE